MRVGLVGFAGSGKSTLFQLLTGATPDPGKVHSGQVGVATLADPRLDFLAALHKPKKVTPATVELLDTPGLMPGHPRRQPPAARPDPRGRRPPDRPGRLRRRRPRPPLAAFRDEMLFADLTCRHQPRRAARGQRQEAPARPRSSAQGAGDRQGGPGRPRRGQVRRLARPLRRRQEAAAVVRPPDRQAAGRPPQHQSRAADSPNRCWPLAPDALAIDAKLELELAQLDPEERAAFMADLGITELGRDRIIRQAYDAVGIITFFTAGEPEVRGWNLERGATAVEAAGKIHTDLAKGFIRAEVTAFDDLRQAGSVKEAKAKHLQRLEGKDYVVKDGDVIYFRSAV